MEFSLEGRSDYTSELPAELLKISIVQAPPRPTESELPGISFTLQLHR